MCILNAICNTKGIAIEIASVAIITMGKRIDIRSPAMPSLFPLAANATIDKKKPIKQKMQAITLTTAVITNITGNMIGVNASM
jgi:hypothetical protein